MTTRVTLLVALLGSMLAHVGTAHGFCTNDLTTPYEMENWVDQPEVPVYVDKGLIEQMVRIGGAAWSFTEVIREIHWATTLISTNA